MPQQEGDCKAVRSPGCRRHGCKNRLIAAVLWIAATDHRTAIHIGQGRFATAGDSHPIERLLRERRGKKTSPPLGASANQDFSCDGGSSWAPASYWDLGSFIGKVKP